VKHKGNTEVSITKQTTHALVSGVAALRLFLGMLVCGEAALLLFLGTCSFPIQGQTLDWEQNYTDLYPEESEVILSGVAVADKGIGLRFKFASRLADFAHLVVQTNLVNSADFPSLSALGATECDGEYDLDITDNHKPVAQRYDITVQAVNNLGVRSKAYHIEIGFYPREFYAKSGNSRGPYLILQRSDLVLAAAAAEYLANTEATEADKKFAQDKFGALLKSGASDYARVCALAQALIADLAPHRGIPSDAMTGPGLEQYRRAMAGLDHVWCGNIAAIFKHAAEALEIPVRTIILGNPGGKNKEGTVTFLMAEGHSTNEVFLKDTGQWIWVDLTTECVGAFLDEVGPLNLAEFAIMFAHKDRRQHLRLLEYDPKTGQSSKVPLVGSSHYKTYLNYYKPEQRFTYQQAR
jgi:hypothetical protein